ncbi:hypothetical protein [Xylanimonas ulmi]|uniref:Excreted virulence factor EspC (Type VII ESX diderm) n=1 Tax=Xylanimonas ulmi TaxID=228973 RepID=A0A4Q7M1D6_9MICO|nr:hypothetical protein [Xylanibacterium ulmi]RZS61041.1 hypothetical protein EV386_1322 [Xylanibacterium ulmi]
MRGRLTADTAAMTEMGSRLVSHGYAMSTSVRDDVTGCGSQGVERAVLEFAMSVAVELAAVQAQVVAAGEVANTAAADLEAADAALARAAR